MAIWCMQKMSLMWIVQNLSCSQSSSFNSCWTMASSLLPPPNVTVTRAAVQCPRAVSRQEDNIPNTRGKNMKARCSIPFQGFFRMRITLSYSKTDLWWGKTFQYTVVGVTPSGNPRDLNFSRTVAGITKWFWVTIEENLSYLLPKFEDLIPTSLGDIAI